MIITKILSLTSSMTKSKKIKIAILLVEIGLLLYAINQNETNNEDYTLLDQ